MADLLSDLVAKLGVTQDQAQGGLGTILGALKSHLPADAFSQVLGAVPDGEKHIEAAADMSGGGGGVLGSVMGMAAKMMGGGEAGGIAGVLAKLTALGFSASQLQGFVGHVVEFFKSHLSGDTLAKVVGMLTGGNKTEPS